MQVPFVFGPGDLRLCDVEPPVPGPRDAVLKVASVGICGSDLGFIAQGGLMGPGGQPFPLGHELSATVAAVGDEVRVVRPGDRVIVNPLINMVGNGAAEGGFATHLLIREVEDRPQSLLALPPDISFDVGALVEPLAVAAHAVNQSGAAPGATAAVFGAGPIGLGTLVMLRQRGITDVVVFDLSPFRRERALALGARAAFDPREHAPAEVLRREHGTALSFGTELPATTHYFEASGAPVIPEVIAMARPGATLCVVSVQKKPVTVEFGSVMAKELRIVGALGYPTELGEVLAALRASPIDLAPMISHRFPGDQVIAAFATAQQPDRAAKVLVQYDA